MEFVRFLREITKGTCDYLEIREIDHEGSVKQHFLKSQDISKYKPPLDVNVYFGVYSRNKKSGKSKYCNTTRVLWVDFDRGMKELTKEKKVSKVQNIIKTAGLPKPSLMISSGNGIHAYWLLKERQHEVTDILRAIAKLTGADMNSTDKARIMRLPDTMNVKDKNNPLKCEVLQADYSLIYDFSLFTKLLKDCIDQTKEMPLQANLKPAKTILDGIKADRPCIESIAQGVSKGDRNFALGRLTKWLQIKGYTKNKSQQIIISWNNLNDPPESISKLIKDFNMYWHGDYRLLGCVINKLDLQQTLNKYCNRPECNFTMAIGNIMLDNTVKYNNRLLKDLDKITGNDLIIYGILVRHKEGLATSLLTEKLTSRLGRICMSNKTMLNSLNTLNKLGFIQIIEGNRRAGKENHYKAIPQGTYGLGYTLIPNGAINGAIDKRVTAGEFRVYVLLLKYAFNKGACYPSLDILAKELRTTTNNVSILLNRLEKADFIKKVYKQFNGVEKLDLRLLV